MFHSRKYTVPAGVQNPEIIEPNDRPSLFPGIPNLFLLNFFHFLPFSTQRRTDAMGPGKPLSAPMALWPRFRITLQVEKLQLYELCGETPIVRVMIENGVISDEAIDEKGRPPFHVDTAIKNHPFLNASKQW